MPQRRNISFIVLGAVVSFTLVAAPYRLLFNGSLPKLQFQTAAAKDKGKDKDTDKGKDNNGRKGQEGNNSGGQGQGNSTSSKGQGRAIGAESADQGSGTGAESADRGGGNLDQADDFGADFGRRPNEHNNPVSGTKTKIDGSNIRVLHPDGMVEEIRSGNYEMKDAMGRTIIRRRAKESDRARLRGMN